LQQLFERFFASSAATGAGSGALSRRAGHLAKNRISRRRNPSKSGILETKFEELIDSLSESTIEKFQNFLEATKDTNQYVSEIKNELKKILYDNRQIVSQTRKHST
jgi:hypothetical protein